MAKYFNANQVKRGETTAITLENGVEVLLTKLDSGSIKAINKSTGIECVHGAAKTREKLEGWENAVQEASEGTTRHSKGQSIGYIRVSTVGQNTDRQLADIELDKTFEEKVSAKTTDRPALASCMDYCRTGDTLHIHSLDRVCRSGAGDAVAIVETMTSKGVGVVFHKEGMTFNGCMTAAQKGILSILASVAQMERELIRERQAEGIAAAKASGKHMGRPKAEVTKQDILSLKDKGLSMSSIAKKLGIGRATAYRLLDQ
ncbi:recombinase family protein [Vibrio harveyi]|uniref:recombinase family protein n=1 Tax=Vibrio harveyi TaxID=669 RepID=UPI0030C76093